MTLHTPSLYSVGLDTIALSRREIEGSIVVRSTVLLSLFLLLPDIHLNEVTIVNSDHVDVTVRESSDTEVFPQKLVEF